MKLVLSISTLLAIAVVELIPFSAHAFQFQCPSGSVMTTYDSQTALLNSVVLNGAVPVATATPTPTPTAAPKAPAAAASAQAVTAADAPLNILPAIANDPANQSFNGVQLVRVKGQGAFSVVTTDGKTVAQFLVSGHPLNATVSFQQGTSNVSCTANGDLSTLFEQLIDNPKVIAGMSAWHAWLKTRSAACDSMFDSVSFFQPQGSGKTALVLHGFSSYPGEMLPTIRLLLDNGYNVIAPRLKWHWDTDITDLDKATFYDWERDSEQGLRVARAFGAPITVVGYSLGGLLAGRLAIRAPTYIDRMVLLAPAWRVGSSTSFGIFVGSLFNVSLNAVMHVPIGCRADAGYTPSRAGSQVESLAGEFEIKNHGTYPSTLQSVFAQIAVPTLLFTTPGDTATDYVSVGDICHADPNYCTHVSIPDRTHQNIINDLNVPAEGQVFGGHAMSELMTSFLNK